MLDQVNIYTLIVSAITIPNVLFLYVMSPVHFNGAMPLHYMHYYNIIHTLSICLFLSISLSRTLYINLSRSLSIFSSFPLICLSHSHSFSLIFFFYLFFSFVSPTPKLRLQEICYGRVTVDPAQAIRASIEQFVICETNLISLCKVHRDF